MHTDIRSKDIPANILNGKRLNTLCETIKTIRQISIIIGNRDTDKNVSKESGFFLASFVSSDAENEGGPGIISA